MNTALTRRSLLVLAAASPVCAAAFDLGALFGTKGSGRVIHHESDLAEFDAIEVSGALQVVVHQARPTRLIVDVDDNLLASIEAEIKGRTLSLRAQGNPLPTRLDIAVNAWVLNRVAVSGSASVSMPEFVCKRLGLQADGAAHVTIDKLTAEQLSVQLSGAAGISVGAGRANDFDVEASGAGVLKASGFEVRRVSAQVSGAAHADVWAVDSLAGGVSGAGHLRYRGEPKLGVERSGAGSVTRAS